MLLGKQVIREAFQPGHWELTALPVPCLCWLYLWNLWQNVLFSNETTIYVFIFLWKFKLKNAEYILLCLPVKSFYMFYNSSRLPKVQTKLNKCIRFIFFSHNKESGAPYPKLLEYTHNIDIIFKIKISLLAHKISQNEANIPEVLQNYLVKVPDIHSHNTRYASDLNFHVPRVRSNYGKHTFKFAITKTWEEIPTKIKTLSYHKFKKEYKRILVNSQR